MQRTRLLFVLGSSLLTSLGVIAACTDNGNSPLPTGGTSSGNVPDSSTPRRDTGRVDPEEEDGGGEEGDGGGDSGACADAPRLRTTTGGGFFCSFLNRDAGGAPDGGSRTFCANSEICCNAQSSLNFCVDKDAGSGRTICEAEATRLGGTWNDDFNKAWECVDKSACSGGEVCCMYTSPNEPDDERANVGPHKDTDLRANCNAQEAYRHGGTRCAATCGARDVQLCSLTDDNCAGGKKCSPFKAGPGSLSLGYCK